MSPEILEQIKPLIPKALQYVEKEIEKTSFRTVLQGLHVAADKVMDLVNNETTCSKGCDFCCYDKINVTKTEIAVIDNFVRKNHIIADPVNTKPWNERKYAEYKCRYLRNGECMIYPVRPFVCRTHNSKDDAELCKRLGYDEELKAMKKKKHEQAYVAEIAALYFAFTILEARKKGLTFDEYKEIIL